VLCLKCCAGGIQATARLLHHRLQLLQPLLKLLVQLHPQRLRLPPAYVNAFDAEGISQQPLIVQQLGPPGGSVFAQRQHGCIEPCLLLLHGLLLGLQVTVNTPPLRHQLSTPHHTHLRAHVDMVYTQQMCTSCHGDCTVTSSGRQHHLACAVPDVPAWTVT
jgi:hypothetical protein